MILLQIHNFPLVSFTNSLQHIQHSCSSKWNICIWYLNFESRLKWRKSTVNQPMALWYKCASYYVHRSIRPTAISANLQVIYNKRSNEIFCTALMRGSKWYIRWGTYHITPMYTYLLWRCMLDNIRWIWLNGSRSILLTQYGFDSSCAEKIDTVQFGLPVFYKLWAKN